jgi:hypothetical protein
MIMGTLGAWMELFKVGRVGPMRKNFNIFFKENVIKAFNAFILTPKDVGQYKQKNAFAR